MSARFNFGAKLAEEVKDLGFTGDLGYQTFLYPSEKEVSKQFVSDIPLVSGEEFAALPDGEASKDGGGISQESGGLPDLHQAKDQGGNC